MPGKSAFCTHSAELNISHFFRKVFYPFKTSELLYSGREWLPCI